MARTRARALAHSKLKRIETKRTNISTNFDWVQSQDLGQVKKKKEEEKNK